MKLLRDAAAQAVIMVGAYQASAGFVRDARESGWDAPIHSVSFVGAEQMLHLLRAEEEKTGRKLTGRLIVTQVVPAYTDTGIPLVREYQAAIDKYHPQAPAGVGNKTRLEAWLCLRHFEVGGPQTAQCPEGAEELRNALKGP